MFLFILLLCIFMILPLRAGFIDRCILAALFLPVLFIALNMAGVAVHSNLRMTGLAALLLIFALYRYGQIRKRVSNGNTNRVSRIDAIATSLFVLLFFGTMEFIYAGNDVLPAYDTIAVPSMAYQTFLSGNVLLDHFAPGSFHAAYPPGYPIILSLFYSYCEPAQALLVFKHLNLFVVACLPFMWAWTLRRIFSLRTALLPFVIACYVGFFCLDRNLSYALPIAGKNATLLMGFFFPFVLYFFLKASESRLAFGTGFMALFALYIIHYSAIGMMFVAMTAFLLIKYPLSKKDNLKINALTLGAFVLSVMTFVFFLQFTPPHRALYLPCSTPGMLQAFGLLLNTFIAPNNDFFFLFSSASKTTFPFLYRGGWLIVLLGIILWAKWSLGRPSRRTFSLGAEILDLGLFSGGAVILCAGLAALSITKNVIYVDYIRWFAFFFFASFIGVVLTMLATTAWMSPNRLKKGAAFVALGAIIVMGLYWFASDGRQLRAKIARCRVSSRELAEAAARLAALEQNGPSCLIALSHPVPEGMRFHENKLMDYVPALSSLRLATGSWMYAPRPHCNSMSNLPALPALSNLWAQGAVYFIGTRAAIDRYSKALPAVSIESFGPPFGTLSLAKVSLRTSSGQIDD